MKIGLIPVSAKPYHAGHHALVEIAARENDSVILFVSTSDRTRKDELPIYGSDMINVWKNHIEKILPGNVDVQYGGSPVRKVYEALGDAEKVGSKDTFTVYSDPTDTARNYPESSRVKNFADLYTAGQVLFAAEKNPGMFTRGKGTPDVSGTKIRAAIESGDIKTFTAGMPTGFDHRAVFDILSSAKNESLIREYLCYALKTI